MWTPSAHSCMTRAWESAATAVGATKPRLRLSLIGTNARQVCSQRKRLGEVIMSNALSIRWISVLLAIWSGTMRFLPMLLMPLLGELLCLCQLLRSELIGDKLQFPFRVRVSSRKTEVQPHMGLN